jgi:hypothetical protein
MWTNLQISNFRPADKNTLRGYFDLTLDTGMQIRGCTFHVRDQRRWIGLPSRHVIAETGGSWVPLIGFEDKRASWAFSDAVVEAVEAFLAACGAPIQQTFHSIPPQEREFILSGITPEEWGAIHADEG